MSLMEILDTIQIEDWVIRRRIPAGAGPFPLFVLLHGWTGDENAMWIFASRLPAGAMLLAPRACMFRPWVDLDGIPSTQSLAGRGGFSPGVGRALYSSDQ